jgi:hypothetical protein
MIFDEGTAELEWSIQLVDVGGVNKDLNDVN